MPVRATALLLALSACGDGLVTGSVGLCLGADPAPDDLPDAMTEHTWSVSGTVVDDTRSTDPAEAFDVSGCFDVPARTLTLTDGEGATWRVGYGVAIDGEDRTPALGLAAADAVQIDFVRMVVWGSDHGLVVRDGTGDLRFAAEQGLATDLDEAPGDPLPELVVTVSDPEGPTDRGDCGRRRNVLLSFAADETALVSAGAVGEVPLGGAPLQVLNAGSFTYTGPMTCTDTWGPTQWAAWRE